MLDITNYYEQLVMDQIWELAKNPTLGLSQQDLEDIGCLALNNLPPCYVKSRADMSSYISDSQFLGMSEEVKKAVAKALKKVQEFPHNDRF